VTVKVCAPSASDATWSGLSQAAAAPPSMLQAKVEPGFVDWNPKLGEGLLVGPVGPAVIEVSGTAESTVKSRRRTVVSTLPAASVAWTRNVCAPSSSAGATVNGLAQPLRVMLSIEQRKVTLDSEAEKVKVGVASAVVPLGPPVIVVSGGVVSTVK
jgi:hypothetical protein